jgi:hypothetical protein
MSTNPITVARICTIFRSNVGSCCDFRFVMQTTDDKFFAANFIAKEIETYRKFALALLSKTGQVFDQPLYEKRGGNSLWRQELARGLTAGDEAAKVKR